MMHPDSKYTVPMSRKEINALSILARAGNIKARDKIVLSHYRFLVRCAGGYVGCGVPIEDLISEGMIGLIRATETFEAARGVAFSSYAVWWVKNCLTRLIHEQSLAVRVPANFFIKGKGPNQIYDRKRGLSQEETEKKNKVRIERSEAAIRAVRGSSPLQIDGDYGNALISDEPQPDQGVVDSMNKKKIYSLLPVLEARDREVVLRYFGIDREPEGLQSIADSMGISKEYVRQRRNHALEQLKWRAGGEK